MLDGCGFIANSLDEYINEMRQLKQNGDYYDLRAFRTIHKYYLAYDVTEIEKRILSIYI